MAVWSENFVRELIEIFRSERALWDIKSKEYTDRKAKDAAYSVLIEKVKTVDPKATRETIVKKINNLRSSFRKEHKKVLKSKKSGSNSVHQPKLWYYYELLFLTKLGQRKYKPLHQEGSESEDSICIKEEYVVQTICEPVVSPSSDNSSQPSSYNQAKNSYSTNEVFSLVGEQQPGDIKYEDKFDIFGKNVAVKLRSLNNEQRIYAEKIINDALFEAELGNLSRHCKILLNNDNIMFLQSVNESANQI